MPRWMAWRERIATLSRTITQRGPSASTVPPTHAKLTSVLAGLQRFAPICRALSAPLSLAGNGGNCGEKVCRTGTRCTAAKLLALGGLGLLAVHGFELSVERRTADLEPARHLRHLAPIVGDRETDDLGFDLLDRPYLAIGPQQGKTHG